MSAEERIAKAIERQNEMIEGIITGVFIAVVAIAVIILIFFFLVSGGFGLVDYIHYEVMGNERVSMGGVTVAWHDPIDDCTYSEDQQLCYQMERIADALENKTDG